MMWFGDHVNGWGFAFMGIGTLVFWGLILAGVVAGVRYLQRSEQQRAVRPVDRQRPEQVLAERFARGQIDDEEYRRRLETLRASGRPAVGP